MGGYAGKRPRPVAAAGIGSSAPTRAHGARRQGSRGWAAARGRDNVRRVAVAAGMSGCTPA
jgi:hypothetical protein